MNQHKFKDLLDKYPPITIRLVARHSHGRRWITRAMLIRKSGLCPRTVDRVSRAKSWKGIDVDVQLKFLDACEVDLLDMSKHVRFLKRSFKAAIKKDYKKVAKIFSSP